MPPRSEQLVPTSGLGLAKNAALSRLTVALTRASDQWEALRLATAFCFRLVPGLWNVSLVSPSKSGRNLQYYKLNAGGEGPRSQVGVRALCGSAAGLCIQLDELVDLPDYKACLVPYADWKQLHEVEGAVAFVAAPVKTVGKVFGALVLASTKQNAFNGIVDLVRALAAIIAPYYVLQRFQHELTAVDAFIQSIVPARVAQFLSETQSQPYMASQRRADHQAAPTLNILRYSQNIVRVQDFRSTVSQGLATEQSPLSYQIPQEPSGVWGQFGYLALVLVLSMCFASQGSRTNSTPIVFWAAIMHGIFYAVLLSLMFMTNLRRQPEVRTTVVALMRVYLAVVQGLIILLHPDALCMWGPGLFYGAFVVAAPALVLRLPLLMHIPIQWIACMTVAVGVLSQKSATCIAANQEKLILFYFMTGFVAPTLLLAAIGPPPKVKKNRAKKNV